MSVVASAMQMDLWILEEYEKEVWFNKYRINIQGIRGMPNGIRSKYFRPLVVSDEAEAVVNFSGHLVLHDLKHHTCIQIEGINGVLVDDFFLYEESFDRHDFFSAVTSLFRDKKCYSNGRAFAYFFSRQKNPYKG